MFLPNYDNTGVTLELGDLVASGFPLFDFDYPVPRPVIEYNGKSCTVDFDKARLEKKIIDHYRFRQIGQETPARFKHYLKTRMCEIMPYYVQVYEFDAKFRNIEDPLESYNLLETFTQETQDTGKVTGKNNAENTGTSSGTSSNTSSSTSSNTSSGTTSNTSSGTSSTTNNKTVKFSDTPQGSISNLDNYLTQATQENVTESGTSSGQTSGHTSGETSGHTSGETSGHTSGNTTEKVTGTSEQSSQGTGRTTHTLNRRGNIGVQPLGGEVENIRSAFINIDMQIINDLQGLFLMIY